uniref:Kazal-like domain-containing protein n=1 Tax=Anopheles stephensi TaxID=30069 RepID=A0A182YNF8_ANOST
MKFISVGIAVLLLVAIASVSCMLDGKEKPNHPRLVAPTKMESTTAKPCPCARTYKPVCASDGHTYNNACSFRCAKQLNRALHVKSEGRCGEVKAVCRKMRFQFFNCLVLLIVPFLEVVLSCSVGCFPPKLCCCTMRHRPVCGNNNRTYHNYCVLRCLRLTRVKNLRMEHRWECGTTPSDWEEREMASVMMPNTENIPPASLGVFNETVERWEIYAHLD